MSSSKRSRGVRRGMGACAGFLQVVNGSSRLVVAVAVVAEPSSDRETPEKENPSNLFSFFHSALLLRFGLVLTWFGGYRNRDFLM